MSSNGNSNNNNNAASASSSSSNTGRGGAQPATASYGRGVGRGAGRGRGQPRGRSCYRCGQMGHFVRNCPRRNNLQQAPPRGGSTAHRGRGGSVEAGHSASSPAPSTPVHDVVDSPPPAKEMESLSLTAQPTGTQPASATSPPVSLRASATSPTVSPRASAPSPPASRPGPRDSDTAVDEEMPPYFWKPAESSEGREEQNRLFLEYYKKRGFAYDEEKKVFLPRAHNYWTEYNGETFFRSKRVQQGGLGDDTYDEDFVVHTAPASALPELEEKRLKDLAEAREKLARAQQAPDGPDKAKTVRSLEKEVRLLVNPLEQYVPVPMPEEDVRQRQVEQPSDIDGDDSREETMSRFGHILERMSAVGALGTVEVPGPDGKMVKQNRTWANGEVWRPKSESKDWEAWADDEPPTSTFHGFIPRHPRPDGIGLGHLGYDSVYTRSRDGIGYTSEDVPDQDWEQSVNAPMIFEADDGTRTVVDYKLKEDNPCIIKRQPPKPLSQILAEEEAANADKAAHQGGDGIGLGHLGYGSVYTRSGEGVGYTSEDVPDQVWDPPLVFETHDGEQWVIDRPLEKDNPVFGGRDPSKPLSQILAEEKAADAAKAAHQGGVGRGSGRGAGGQGAQVSPDEGWH